MKTKIGVSILAGLSGLMFAPPTATALPPDQTIQLRFRSEPGNPESPVVLDAVLHLSAESTSGEHLVGWRIDRAQFSRRVDNRSDHWSAPSLPTSDSSDGLWWVEHHDAQAPDISEFTVHLPSISGSAMGGEIGQTDLDFALEGTQGSSSTTPPNAQTANAGYYFNVADDEEPIADDDDEPVEVLEDNN
jgi:hypothetical protein